jgi:hypothetical protein
MDELGPQELEELVQELERESEEEEALSPEVEALLRDLGPWSPKHTRRDAAEQLGRVGTSSPRIVQALITACESPSELVSTAAAKSLRAPVHQECLQQHPELTEEAESAQQQRKLLSPSELVLLHGDKFATTSSAAVRLGEWVRLVHMDTYAEARELGRTMLAAAFLADEQAGAVRLEVRQQQALFGLLTLDKLFVSPRADAVSWPSYCFESQLRGIAARLQSKSGKGHNHVSEIVYDWWMGRAGRKSSSPWTRLGGLVKDGLVSRRLLRKERKSGLKGFLAGESYVLPAETAALSTQQSLGPVRELLATCRRTRLEVWDLLIVGINKGIGKCKEDDWD